MPQYDLSDEHQEKLAQIARERGVSIDRVVDEIVHDHMINTNKITRFVAKKGPKNKSNKRA